jgi:hypothetical protein
MSENARMWMEISFNLAYLVVIYGIVIAMIRQQKQVSSDDRALTNLFVTAFGLLALGDTGHVGFRVLAYAQGDLTAQVSFAGSQLGLVGMGALATAITVTFFYVLMLVIWHVRFKKPYGWFGALLFAAAGIRLVVMALPGNGWNNLVPEQPWSTYRNLPLMAQGLGVAYLILRDALATNDRTFTWIGAMILTSYAFYMPVIFFVQRVPSIGMLMIPKTLAYVAIAFIAYNRYYRAKSPSLEAQLVQSP